MNATIYPPSCLGILGGGQLGRMLAMVAKQMGYKVAILEPDPNCPARHFSDYHIQKPYSDKEGLAELAKLAQVVTTEFENVPAEALDFLANSGCLAYPKANAVTIAQNRLREKRFFRELGLATADFAAINSLLDCKQAASLLPGILKTTTQGYDGKGQRRVNSIADLETAYAELGGECILERLIELDQEVSIIVARNHSGIEVFPLIENRHLRGILDVSTIPAQVTIDLASAAKKAATAMVEALDYTGVLTIEFFISKDRQLLVNEIAPRPHNSGHVTIEACVTSQFEQQLRAVCGLPLGDCRLKTKGMMLNLLGDIWANSLGENPFVQILQFDPRLKLHWYEKNDAKPGRKMGHVTIAGNDLNELKIIIDGLKQQLNIC